MTNNIDVFYVGDNALDTDEIDDNCWSSIDVDGAKIMKWRNPNNRVQPDSALRKPKKQDNNAANAVQKLERKKILEQIFGLER